MPNVIGKCNCGGNIVETVKPGSQKPGLESGIVYGTEAYCDKCGIFYRPDIVKKNNRTPEEKKEWNRTLGKPFCSS